MEKRFYTSLAGYNIDAFKQAFSFAIKLANSDSTIKRIVIYGITKSQFDIVTEAFGSNNLKAMQKGNIKSNLTNVPITCKTIQNYVKSTPWNSRDLVIALYMDDKELFDLEDSGSAECIIAIPWILDRIQDWIARYDAKDIDSSSQNPTTIFTHLNKKQQLLEVALNKMDVAMFGTKSFSHPQDEDQCKNYIRAIYKYIPDVLPVNIENYLVANLKWTNSNAKSVSKLLKTLQDGRNFRGGNSIDVSSLYIQWQQELEK